MWGGDRCGARGVVEQRELAEDVAGLARLHDLTHSFCFVRGVIAIQVVVEVAGRRKPARVDRQALRLERRRSLRSPESRCKSRPSPNC